LPETEIVEIEDSILYVLHDVNRLDLDPAAAGFRAVIGGHSHTPSQQLRAGGLRANRALRHFLRFLRHRHRRADLGDTAESFAPGSQLMK
jgi:hypothetical protein